MRRMNVSTGNWGDWKNAGNPGNALGFPAVCEAFGAGNAFVPCSQSSVFGKVFPRGSTAFAWQHLGSNIYGDAAAVAAGKSLHLFATGSDLVVRHRRFQAGPRTWGWQSAWDDLGMAINEPAAVRVGDKDIHVFAPAVGELLHWHWDGATWNDKPPLAGVFEMVRAVSWGPNRLDLFGRGGDGPSIYHRSWNGVAWSPSPNEEWEDLGGDFYPTQVPSVVTWGPDRLDLFVLASWSGVATEKHANGNVWHCWWDGAGWDPQD